MLAHYAKEAVNVDGKIINFRFAESARKDGFTGARKITFDTNNTVVTTYAIICELQTPCHGVSDS